MPVKFLKIDFFKLTGIIFLGGVLFLIIFLLFLPNYTKIKELREEYQTLSEKIEETREEINSLKVQLNSIDKDSFYLEKVAREDLGVSRDNEIVIKIEE